MNGLFFPGLIVPVLNAYRDEVYYGFYRSEKGSLSLLAEDTVTGVQTLIAEIGKRDETEPLLFLGNGLKVCVSEIRAALDSKRVEMAPPPFNYPHASHVAYLALRQGNQGFGKEPVLPNYLRRPG